MISSPLRPLVMAAAGSTLTLQVACGAAHEEVDQRAVVDHRAAVSGIATKLVTPPAAAASPTRLQRLAVLAAGLAGEDAHVDEAGGDDVALGVVDARRHPARRAARRRRCRRCVPSSTRMRAGAVAAGGRIDDPRVVDDERRAHALALVADRRSSASSTAMRTATPISTWSVITERGAVGDRRIDLDAAVHRARDA